ncbi:flagellar protein FlgN [Shewanella sp. D64]|uniref:flagellar protein FlgN n=1 Tax=unclassified Shewanella TaxID=196818 RepID=UPI0022BA43DF|nr:MULTISPECIES: flagellar protein FlgN [unclassified Shewanella]MEC4725918.1 flagellar protein FlgN [Shewanella sp. D64]MEC4737173.1 flagellar protein FlgN [Shewanella sp. E94]WBJ95635.1 flagellar protein FlgN [Shewanella sp. MTB7]
MSNKSESKRELVQEIIRGVRQDIEGYKQLRSLLSQQRELMQRRDNQGLELHNRHQLSLCEQLQSRANKRSRGLIQLGFSGDAAGMDQLITKLPVDAAKQVKILWNNLLILVKESKMANDINGNLLVDQQAVINGLLNRDKEVCIDYGVSTPS